MQRFLALFAALSYLPALSALHITPPLTGEQIARRMEEQDKRRAALLCGYKVQRSYELQNKHLNPSATMTVEVTYQKGRPKVLDVLSIKASGVAKRSLLDLLTEESESEGRTNQKSALAPENYELTFIDLEACGTRSCYKVGMKPKHRSKYLIEGFALVDAQDYAFVRISGTLSKSPSFWLSKPEVEQRFEKTGGFWLPSFNRSTTKVVFLGEASLTVQYGPYTVSTCKCGAFTVPVCN